MVDKLPWTATSYPIAKTCPNDFTFFSSGKLAEMITNIYQEAAM